MSLLLGLVSLKPRSIRGDENRRQKPGKTRNKPGVRAEPGNRIEDGNGRRRITDEQNDGWLKNGLLPDRHPTEDFFCLRHFRCRAQG